MSPETPSTNPTEPTPETTPTAPAADAKPALPENKVQIEDAGTLKKKITITVTQERIDAKRNEMFGELSSSAQIPGFRLGHAPRRLIEKRFGREISNDVRNALVGESIGQAAEAANLRTLGEPNLELDKIELPEKGEMTFSFEVEVAPDFDLPELKGIKVERPVIEITAQRVDEAIETMRRNQARYEPTTEAAAASDAVLAGAKISAEGIEPLERHGLTLRVAPGQVEGLPLLELGTQLAGKKAGDSVTVTAKAPESHPNEAWRGKDLNVELTISEVRHLVLPEMNDETVKAMGFESLVQFRGFLEARLQERVATEAQQGMHAQICKYLLDNTKFDLPEGVVTRHAAQLVMRRSVDLMQQGVPKEQIEANLAKLQAAAAEQAKDDMRLSFILGKFAEQEKIVTNEAEVNSRVAEMARQYNRRPERMRQEMEADGSLQAMAERLQEEKALDALLAQAQVVDVDPDAKAAEQAAAPAAEQAAAPADEAKAEAKGEPAAETTTEQPAAPKAAKRSKKAKE